MRFNCSGTSHSKPIEGSVGVKAFPLLRLAFAVILFAPVAVAAAQERCRSPEALVRLDHAIVVVRDLDSAAARFAKLGFVFKQGRLHPDSLLNRHIKFRDGTEVELMTVAGTPTSRMSREYRRLLDAGEGGVYAALWTDDIEKVEKVAAGLGGTRITRAGAWTFLGLPGIPDAGAVWIGGGGLPANDPDSVLAHANGADGLVAAWVEAGPTLDTLLARLGSRRCGEATLPDGRRGVRWGLAKGSLVVVRDIGRRVAGVEVERKGGTAASLGEPLRGFWVRLVGN